MRKSKTVVWLVVLVVLLTGVLAACRSGFKVTYAAGENGTLTATVDGESLASGDKAGSGKIIEFVATPASGYAVGEWTVNGTAQTTGIESNGTKLTLVADKELEVGVSFKRLYNVTWELDGGRWPAGYTPVTIVAEGDKLSAPSAVDRPVKDGYTFLGWFTSEGGSESFNFTPPVGSDKTVYAKWEVTVNRFEVVFSYGANGYIMLTADDDEDFWDSPARIPEGSAVVVSVVPNLGYHVESFLVDGEPAELTDENTYIIESLDAKVELSAQFVYGFDDTLSVAEQAEILRDMLMAIGEASINGNAFSASEVTYDSDVGMARFTASGDTFGNSIDAGYRGGFKVSIFENPADALYFLDNFLNTPSTGEVEGRVYGIIVGGTQTTSGRIVVQGTPHGCWTIQTLYALGVPGSVGTGTNIVEPFASQAIGMRDELQRHRYTTSTSGIDVFNGKNDNAYGLHVWIEQNQGSAGINITRFSGRVFADEAWAQAALDSSYLADTKCTAVKDNVMINSNSPVLLGIIEALIDGAPINPNPSLSADENFLTVDFYNMMMSEYNWDIDPRWSKYPEYYGSITEAPNGGSGMLFTWYDFALFRMQPQSAFGYSNDMGMIIIFSTEEAAIEFYESNRHYNSETCPSDWLRSRFGKIVVYGQEIPYYGLLDVLSKEGVIGAADLPTQEISWAVDGANGDMFASLGVLLSNTQVAHPEGESAGMFYPDPVVVNQLENGGKVVKGSVVELTFEPADGYFVRELLINGNPVGEAFGNSYRFTVEEDVSIVVSFGNEEIRFGAVVWQLNSSNIWARVTDLGEGWEYSAGNDKWQDGTSFVKLPAQDIYIFTARMKEDHSRTESFTVVVGKSFSGDVLVLESGSDISAVVKSLGKGWEYSAGWANNNEWQTSNVFTGLLKSNVYVFSARKAGEETRTYTFKVIEDEELFKTASWDNTMLYGFADDSAGAAYQVLYLPDTLGETSLVSVDGFYSASALKTIVVADGIVTLDGFGYLTNLENVIFGENSKCTTIGSFTNTSVSSIVFPKGLKTINGSAFQGTKLAGALVIPEGVTSIGSNAFKNCKLITSVSLPSTLAEMSSSAFEGCSELAQVTFAAGNVSITTISAKVFAGTKITSITLPRSISFIAAGNPFGSNIETFAVDEGTTEAGVVVNDGILYYKDSTGLVMAAIPVNYTFDNNIFTVPAGVSKISGKLFAGSGIVKVVLGEDVVELMTDAFSGVSTLTEVVFAENGNLVTIGSSAFKGTSLENVEIPNTVKTLGANAFDGVTTLKALTFEEGGSQALTIKGQIIKGTSLTSIVFPARSLTLDSKTFENVSTLENVTFTDSANDLVLNETVFKGTNVSALNFGNRVITLKKAALQKLTTLTSVTFGENAVLQEAGDEVFLGTSLTTVELPQTNVSKFGNGVFGGIATLTSFTLAQANTTHQVIDGVLYAKDGDNLILVQVPAGKFGSEDTFNLPDNVVSIKRYAFEGVSLDTIYTSADSKLATLEQQCFGYYSTSGELYCKVKTIVLPATLTSVNKNAFQNCKNLTTINFRGSAVVWMTFGLTLSDTVKVNYNYTDPVA